VVGSQPRQIVCKSLLGNTHHKKGLVKWLKVQALSSNPSATKKKKKKNSLTKTTKAKAARHRTRFPKQDIKFHTPNILNFLIALRVHLKWE
jgi:hypothetical protein